MGEREAVKQRQTIGQHRETEWTDGDADEDETQYRAEPQPVEKWDYNCGCGQDDQGWLEQSWVELRVQVSVSVFKQETMECLRHQAGRLDAGEMPRVDLDVFGSRDLPCHWFNR